MAVATEMGVEFDEVRYLKEPPAAATLRAIIAKLEDPVENLVRKDAFFFYKAAWSEEPVLHVAGRRHVVRDAQDMLVTFYDGYVATAQVVAFDDYSDLAVIRIEPPSRV